jgi:hypothetical protein
MKARDWKGSVRKIHRRGRRGSQRVGQGRNVCCRPSTIHIAPLMRLRWNGRLVTGGCAALHRPAIHVTPLTRLKDAAFH